MQPALGKSWAQAGGRFWGVQPPLTPPPPPARDPHWRLLQGLQRPNQGHQDRRPPACAHPHQGAAAVGTLVALSPRPPAPLCAPVPATHPCGPAQTHPHLWRCPPPPALLCPWALHLLWSPQVRPRCLQCFSMQTPATAPRHLSQPWQLLSGTRSSLRHPPPLSPRHCGYGAPCCLDTPPPSHPQKPWGKVGLGQGPDTWVPWGRGADAVRAGLDVEGSHRAWGGLGQDMGGVCSGWGLLQRHLGEGGIWEMGVGGGVQELTVSSDPCSRTAPMT